MNTHTSSIPFATTALKLRFLLAFLLVAGLNSAMADDWKGGFIGLEVAGADALAEITSDGVDIEIEAEDDPLLVGIRGGYTWPLMGAAEGNKGFRLGTQFGLAFGDYAEDQTDEELGDIEIKGTTLAFAGGRLGYTWDRIWLYATVGLSASDFYVQPDDSDDTQVLLTGSAGIGAEYKINGKWSLQAELLSVGSGENKETFNGIEREVETEHSVLRLGAVWKF